MSKRKIDSITISKWARMFRLDNIAIDTCDKIIQIDCSLKELHPAHQERIKTLQKKNKYKLYQQLTIFDV